LHDGVIISARARAARWRTKRVDLHMAEKLMAALGVVFRARG